MGCDCSKHGGNAPEPPVRIYVGVMLTILLLLLGVYLTVWLVFPALIVGAWTVNQIRQFVTKSKRR